MTQNSSPNRAKSTASSADRATSSGRSAVASARRSQHSGRGWWIAGAGVVVFAIAVILIITLTRRPAQTTSVAVPSSPRLTAVGAHTPPPWPAPSDSTAAVRQAGLPMLGSEGVTEHLHAHLDMLVNGKPIGVPRGIGVDEQVGTISPMHTHDTSGVIHIESPQQVPFSLGQLFTQWQVSLAGDHLGGLTSGGGNTVRAFVNGRPVSGNPAAIILHPHDEITLVYGPSDQQTTPPASYNFPSGE